jgi:hypothetical protein
MPAVRKWALPAAVFTAATVAFVAPLLPRFASAYPHDPGDPSLNAWILWWSTRRLPLTAGWWNAPMFYPMRGAMALSEVLIGILPISLPVQALTGSPLAAYNAAFVLAFPLCALAAFALAYELTRDRAAAALAGIAFAFSPYRMSQLGHLQMLAYYGAPIALVGLHGYLRARTVRVEGERAASGLKWLVVFGAGWLLQSLSNGYAMFHLATFIALWLLWFARDRSIATPIVVTWMLASVPLVPVLLEYQTIHSSLHLTRDINEIRKLSVSVNDLWTSAPEMIVWQRLLPPANVETAAFPGVTMIAIAVLGVIMWLRQPASNTRADRGFSLDQRLLIAIAVVAVVVTGTRILLGPWHLGPLSVTEVRKPISIVLFALVIVLLRGGWFRRAAASQSVPVFYILAMVLMYVLALGPSPTVSGVVFLYRPPYEWLMALPGFNTLRVPARFLALASLSGSMILAMVIARVRTSPRLAAASVALTAAGLIVDGAARLPVQPAPSKGPMWKDVDAVLELPAGTLADFAAVHRSMYHRLPILNGYSGYFPPHYAALLYALGHGHFDVLHEFPTRRGIAISVDRSYPGALAVSAALRDTGGSTHAGLSDRLDTFVLHNAPPERLPTRQQRSIASVAVNRSADEAQRMLDGRVDTGWHAGPSQVGDEAVIADLGSSVRVTTVATAMGAFAFGFPRNLEVELSNDRLQWERVWSGPTDIATVRGALADPALVLIRVDFSPATARYVRLRQTGQEPGIPWWIAELHVYGP